MCTGTKTFLLRKADTSNTVLVTEPRDRKRKGCPTDDENDGAAARSVALRVVASVGDTYQLTQTAPKLERLRALLQQLPFRGGAADAEAIEAGAAHGLRVYSWSDLRGAVQASDAELRAGLEALRATELGGCWRVFDGGYLDSLFGAVLDACAEHDWPLRRVPAARAVEALALQGDDESAVRHALRLHGEAAAAAEGEQEAAAGQEAAEPTHWALDNARVGAFVAARILRQRRVAVGAGQPMLWSDFMEEWEMRLPGGMEPDESALRGLAVADTAGSAAQGGDNKVVVFLPKDELPTTAEGAFAALFGAKQQWAPHELEPYLERLVTPTLTLPKLLMKHARSVTAEGGQRAFVAR
jgi:sister chromatid cohesion protein DCC1